MQLYLLPARPVWAVGIISIGVCLAFGRYLAFDGFTWNSIAAVAFLILTAYLASLQEGLRQLGITSKRWRRSAILWSGGAAFLLSAIGATSASLSQSRDGYYQYVDPWVLTQGPTTLQDTNGASYTIPNSGVSLSTLVWTFLIFLCAYGMAAAIGLALGSVASLRGAFGTVVVITAAIAVAVLVIMVLSAFDVRVSAPYPGVFWFCIPATAAALLVMWASPKLAKT